jgi:hypothetical protein
MVGLIDNIVGYSKMAFVRKVCLGDEHDVLCCAEKEMISVLLRGGVGRWRSRVQALEM